MAATAATTRPSPSSSAPRSSAASIWNESSEGRAAPWRASDHSLNASSSCPPSRRGMGRRLKKYNESVSIFMYLSHACQTLAALGVRTFTNENNNAHNSGRAIGRMREAGSQSPTSTSEYSTRQTISRTTAKERGVTYALVISPTVHLATRPCALPHRPLRRVAIGVCAS